MWMCIWVHMFQVGGKALKSPGKLEKGEPVAEIPSDVPGYPGNLRKLSVAMKIIRNNQDLYSYSLTMQILLSGIESKAKVLKG